MLSNFVTHLGIDTIQEHNRFFHFFSVIRDFWFFCFVWNLFFEKLHNHFNLTKMVKEVIAEVSKVKVASTENEVTVRKPKLFEYEFILVKLLKYQSEFWFWKTNKKPSGSPSTWINFNAHEKKILVLTLPAA